MLDGKLSLAISCLLLAKTDLERVLESGVVDHALIDKARAQINKALDHLAVQVDKR